MPSLSRTSLPLFLHQIFLPRLLPVRHTQMAEQRPALFIGLRRRNNHNIEPMDRLYLIELDLREYHLFFDPKRVIPSAVKRLGRHTLKIPDARKCSTYEPVEKFVHPFAPEGHHTADRHPFSELEGCDGFLCAGDNRPLSSDPSKFISSVVEGFGIANCLAYTGVENDLHQFRRLHGVLIAELLHESRHRDIMVPLLEPWRRNPFRTGFLGCCFLRTFFGFGLFL